MLFGKQEEAQLLGRFNKHTIGGLLFLGATMVRQCCW
jgi:hypothetical protein